MALASSKDKIGVSEQEELIMNEQTQDDFLNKELFELKEQYFQLYQEFQAIKQKQLSPKQLLIFAKILIVILVGIETQLGNIQFKGEQILPIVETFANPETEIN